MPDRSRLRFLQLHTQGANGFSALTHQRGFWPVCVTCPSVAQSQWSRMGCCDWLALVYRPVPYPVLWPEKQDCRRRGPLPFRPLGRSQEGGGRSEIVTGCPAQGLLQTRPLAPGLTAQWESRIRLPLCRKCRSTGACALWSQGRAKSSVRVSLVKWESESCERRDCHGDPRGVSCQETKIM